MNREVFITCAVTGSGDTVGKNPNIPVTPEQIAAAALEAADAGAAIAHIHVRNPETGKGCRDVHLYREVVDRVRSSNRDVIINLTSGMGGDVDIGTGETPLEFGKDTDLVGPIARLAHVEELLPEICSLDCGTLNFGNGSMIFVSTPDMLRAGAKHIRELGVRPELECFDSGHIWFAERMHEEGLLEDPALYQICLGIPWGAPADAAAMMSMRDRIPAGSVWSGFGISAMQMPMVAQAVLLGGNVRIGLEDNLWLEKGVPASNGSLVERAVTIIESMGARVIGPEETREKLDLRKRQ